MNSSPDRTRSGWTMRAVTRRKHDGFAGGGQQAFAEHLLQKRPCNPGQAHFNGPCGVFPDKAEVTGLECSGICHGIGEGYEKFNAPRFSRSCVRLLAVMTGMTAGSDRIIQDSTAWLTVIPDSLARAWSSRSLRSFSGLA